MDLFPELIALPGITIFAAALSAFITWLSIPVIVRISLIKGLLAMPNGRTLHKDPVPNMGGAAIFPGIVLVSLTFSAFVAGSSPQYILAALVILFFIGIKDDFYPLVPFKKFIGQFIAAAIVVFPGDIRILNFHGLFGIGEAGYLLSVLVTLFLIIGLVNSFNFIDGVDGLASTIGLVSLLFFGYWIYMTADANHVVLAASLAGSLVVFSIYNMYGRRNKIFLGDSGAMLTGFMVAIFAILFNEIGQGSIEGYPDSVPAIGLAVLIVPVFDALRVISRRIIKGRSPFSADTDHLHHRLLKLTSSHRKVTLIMIGINILFIIISLLLDSIGSGLLIILILVVATLLSLLVSAAIRVLPAEE